VRVHAQDLVGEHVDRGGSEEDARTLALHDFVALVRFRGVVDLELDPVVGLLGGDPERAHLGQRLDSFVIDLQHRASLTEMRILIAEDETIIRLDLRDLLERAGHEVVGEARDGEEAVALARELAPELAVMDVKMPKLDGIEAAKRILEERPMPIVLLTAYDQEELIARAVEAGVFGYLVKPFREQDLVPAIATARARHEELAAVRGEAESLAEALAARKSIERAKGLLMQKEQLSETDAFARLRKASQVSGKPLKVIADAVIATLDPS
jgi:two-component system, response regulator PdtaR